MYYQTLPLHANAQGQKPLHYKRTNINDSTSLLEIERKVNYLKVFLFPLQYQSNNILCICIKEPVTVLVTHPVDRRCTFLKTEMRHRFNKWLRSSCIDPI